MRECHKKIQVDEVNNLRMASYAEEPSVPLKQNLLHKVIISFLGGITFSILMILIMGYHGLYKKTSQTKRK